MFRVVKAAAVIAFASYSVTAFSAPKVLDAGEDHANGSHGSAKGNYEVLVDGDKVKIHLFLETSKQGVNGTSHGALRFLMLDSTNKVIWDKAQNQSVGAKVLTGAAHKRYDETFTIFGPPAEAIIHNGGTIAFHISVDVTDGAPHSLKEFAADLKQTVSDVTGAIETISPG